MGVAIEKVELFSLINFGIIALMFQSSAERKISQLIDSSMNSVLNISIKWKEYISFTFGFTKFGYLYLRESKVVERERW